MIENIKLGNKIYNINEIQAIRDASFNQIC